MMFFEEYKKQSRITLISLFLLYQIHFYKWKEKLTFKYAEL